MSLKELLKNKLSEDELKLVPSSFDIIGNREKAVAIIDMPEKLGRKQKIIAAALMQKHKNVKAVLGKVSARRGTFRLYSLKIIAGSRNTEVVHKESGCRFILDPRRVYFSPRESTERMRIAQKISNNETVMIFFAGAGPLAVIIGKYARPKHIIGIELNRQAVKYFKKNIALNKINTEIVAGDVSKKAKNFYGKCDRVIMPLPEKAIEYISYALKCLKKKGVCHFYCFSDDANILNIKKQLTLMAKKEKRNIKFLDVIKVLPYGPKIWKMRIDFTISKINLYPHSQYY